jgi:hypothetical protein
VPPLQTLPRPQRGASGPHPPVSRTHRCRCHRQAPPRCENHTKSNIARATSPQLDFGTSHQKDSSKRSERGNPPGHAWASAINPPLQKGCGERTKTQSDHVSERYAGHRHARVKSQRIRNRAKRPHDEKPPGAGISPEREGGSATPEGEKGSAEPHGDRTDSQWGDVWSQKESCGAGRPPQVAASITHSTERCMTRLSPSYTGDTHPPPSETS